LLFILAQKAKVALCVAIFDVLYIQIFPEGMWEGKITNPVLRNFDTRLGSVIRITSHSLPHEENRPQHTMNMMPNKHQKQSGHNEGKTTIASEGIESR
jgi:hypothetical protein